ncbi:MAG: M4 family metallopeptidase [Burkholderiales bacterium]|nr:M4 family metallopeptidase [Burkholderiales bacterium]
MNIKQLPFRLHHVATALALMAAGSSFAADTLLGDFSTAATVQQQANLVNQLNAKRDMQGMDANHGFAISNQHPAGEGTQVARVQHLYKNLPVWGSESVLVLDKSGKLLSESVTDRRLGLGASNALSADGFSRAKALDVQPTLSAQQAINAVVQKLTPAGLVAANLTHQYQPQAQLMIYPIIKEVRVAAAANKAEADLNAMDLEQKVTGHELVYLVKTRMKNGRQLAFHDSIISAHDGRVIEQWNALHTVTATGKSLYNGTVKIENTLSNGVYKMIDSSRGTGGKFGGFAVTDYKHAEDGPGTVYSDSDGTWGDGKNYNGGSTTNANGQTGAVDAMYGFKQTYDMYKNVFGWKSLDGKNTASYIGVHLSTDLDNAYYDDGCDCMSIGDGGSTSFQLSGIDVIGHEMSHGVTAHTSNLAYRGESGGLNEAASDIAGEMVEAYKKGGGTGNVIPAVKPDWVSGKEVAQNGVPLRWFYKPSKDGQSRDAWSSTLSKLDVHYSSGPANRMFYFLANGSSSSSSSDYYSKYLTQSPKAMVGIGNDKAFRIWFKAWTTKFTSSTNYADAQKKTVLAAQELYGANSKEVIAVKRAFAAINVGTDVAGQ